MKTIIAKNNITTFGEGKTVVLFVHGYGCNQKMWRFVTPAFEKDYKVVLIDLVGYGDSDTAAYDTQKYSSLKGYAADIVELCNELNYQNIIFVGHSVSSMIGLHVDLMAPGLIDKLVMIGPSPCYINQQDYVGGFSKEDINELINTVNSNYLGWSSAITPVIMGNPEKPELTEELKNSFCKTDPAIAQQFAKVTFMGDERKHLSKCHTNTLIIQCKSDVIAPVVVGEFVHNNMPNSTLKILDAAGHCPHMSEPEKTIKAIQDFIVPV